MGMSERLEGLLAPWRNGGNAQAQVSGPTTFARWVWGRNGRKVIRRFKGQPGWVVG